MALAVALLAPAVTACGGQGRLSQAELRDRVNAICARYTARSKAITARVGSTRAGVAKAIDRLIPLVDKEAAELTKLSPPKPLDARYRQWIKAGRDQIPVAERLRDAARRNDTGAYQSALAELESRVRQSDSAAGELGFESCANS